MPNMTAELLAPVGNIESLDAAIGEGADAVYLGLKTFNARMRTSNFAYNQFEAALESVHRQNKKIYVTVNTVFEQREADRMYQQLQYLERLGADGIIVQDFGVVKMCQDFFPKLRLHASTQMNVSSAPGANFLSRNGFKRVVLSRELTLDEIRNVCANTNLEIETFVHGALCVSASGLCMFSSYLGGKSANRGCCTQACRRIYTEENRDGYYFSPDDFQLIDRVPDLVEAGVKSLKIEGRMKSSEYVGTVTAAYRYMLDNWRLDRERATVKAKAMLQSDFARSKTNFFIDGLDNTTYIKADQAGGTGIPLGKIKLVRVLNEERYMNVKSFEGIAEGDSIRIHPHGDGKRYTARVKGVKNRDDGFFLRVDGDYNIDDEVYLVQTKSMSRRYKPVLPSSLDKYHRFPSYDKAPLIELKFDEKKDYSKLLPEGLYTLVSRIEDLHTILSDRPEKAILRLNHRNATKFHDEEKTVPFKRDSLIIWLEPYFPQDNVEWLTQEIDYLIEKGQKLFIANNLGHLSLLKGKDVTVITGPWLYSFNTWAASFLFVNGSEMIIPPLEISKQAFGQLTVSIPGNRFFPVIFAYPQLFTIRANYSNINDIRFIRDKNDDEYEVVSEQDGSVVIPIKPFSIIDRVPFIKKNNVCRFIVDFSFVEMRKQIYRRVMTATKDGVVLQEAGRFNWKDGFWNPEEEKPMGRSFSKKETPAFSIDEEKPAFQKDRKPFRGKSFDRDNKTFGDKKPFTKEPRAERSSDYRSRNVDRANKYQDRSRKNNDTYNDRQDKRSNGSRNNFNNNKNKPDWNHGDRKPKR